MIQISGREKSLFLKYFMFAENEDMSYGNLGERLHTKYKVIEQCKLVVFASVEKSFIFTNK